MSTTTVGTLGAFPIPVNFISLATRGFFTVEHELLTRAVWTYLRYDDLLLR
jgi:hypothetical protein